MPKRKPYILSPTARKALSEGGRKGGKIGGPKSPTNFKNNRELAQSAGRKGGKISRNKPVDNPA